MHLESERLILRDFDSSDGNELFEYLSDPDVVRYEPYETYTLVEAINEAASRENNKAFIAICLKESGKLIGNLYYSKTEPDYIDTYEIGYVFNREFQGKGYATEAVKRLLDHIFSNLKAHRVVAFCNPENTPSWNLLERLGFRREAERIDNMFFKRDAKGNPLWFNSYQYALLANEYFRIKSSG